MMFEQDLLIPADVIIGMAPGEKIPETGYIKDLQARVKLAYETAWNYQGICRIQLVSCPSMASWETIQGWGCVGCPTIMDIKDSA